MAALPRLASVDVVRGFAIVAMIVAHTAYLTAGTAGRPVAFAQFVLNSVASPLFALVMGISLGIMAAARGGRPGHGGPAFVRQMVIRAAILIALGLLLRAVPAGVVIVLDYLGIALLISLLFVFLPTRWLVPAIAVLGAAGPFVNGWGRGLVGRSYAFVDPAHPASYLLDWTLTGHAYRATELVPLMLLGVLFARIGPTRRGLAPVALGTGIVLAALGAVVRRYVYDGHILSGSFPDLAWDTGLVLIAFGGITLLLTTDRPRIRRASTALCVPLRETGMLSLTIYVLHVLILGGYRTWFVEPSIPVAWVLTSALVVGCVIFAHLWLRFIGEGPVERLTGLLTGRRSWAQVASVRGYSRLPG